jgi:hypothetical protein
MANRRNRKLNGSAAIINESGSLANVAAAEKLKENENNESNMAIETMAKSC